MADIFNLCAARKAKARNETAITAAANRAAFGRTKTEDAQTVAQRARDAGVLDSVKRDR